MATMVDVVVNATGAAGHDGHWSSKPAWKLPGWAEPVVYPTYHSLFSEL